MKTAEKPLVLTELEYERPGTRGASPMSARPKRAKGGAKRANTTRVNQIVVGAAPKAKYEAEDGMSNERVEMQSVRTSRPPHHEGAPMPLKRSQTAPNGLKRPRTPVAEETPLPSRPASRMETSTRPVSRQETGRVTVRPIHPRMDQSDDAQGEEMKTGKANVGNQNRLYGEMIDSDEVEALCRRLGLLPKDVWRLRKEFNDEDTDNTNTITVSSFFYLIHQEQRALTKSLLRLASPAVATRLTFDEYVRCTVTFATFSEPELFQFFFQVYCDTKSTTGGGFNMHSSNSHAMIESDLMKLGQDLQVLRTAFAGNVQIATGNAVAVAGQGLALEGSLTFADFERFSRQHMVAFYPLLQIQRNVRQAGGLGEAFWIQKTSEKLQVQSLLAYMRRNHGFQPPLPLRDRIVSFVLQRQTTQTRVRELAKQLYAG